MHKIICAAMFIIIVLSVGASAFEADSIFIKANQHFENKDFDKALGGYLILTDSGYESAPLFYNIGNCYIKQGQFGYAIQYYIKAQRLAPGDDDIRTNLAFARQFMPTRLEGVEINPVTEFMDTIVERFTLNSLAWFSSVLFIIFALFLSFIIYFRYRGIQFRIIGYVLVILLMAATILTTYKYRTNYLSQKGVIVSNEARVYSAPDESGNLEFIGAFGLTLEIKKSNADYYLVVFENKRKGWIKKTDVGII